VGGFLLGLWGLPFTVVEAVANHHSPERNADDKLGPAQAVWLASCLVDGEEPDSRIVASIGAAELLPKIKKLLNGFS
jgi:HD-like signal output (HDOD) protein